MSTSTTTHLWVAYGADGNVVGTIRKSGDDYVTTVADADQSLGAYPTMEAAKGALHRALPQGVEAHQLREH